MCKERPILRKKREGWRTQDALCGPIVLGSTRFQDSRERLRRAHWVNRDITAAGWDYGQEFAVRGDREVADGVAAEVGDWSWLADGN